MASAELALEVIITGFVFPPSRFRQIPWDIALPRDLPHIAIRPVPESILTPGNISMCAVPQVVSGPCAPAKNISPPPERRVTPLFNNIPELAHSLPLLPTAYPSGYPSPAASEDQAPRLEVIVAAVPPSS